LPRLQAKREHVHEQVLLDMLVLEVHRVRDQVGGRGGFAGQQRAQAVQVIQVVVERLLPDAVAAHRRRVAERGANLSDGIGRCWHDATRRRSACAQ
jgi:hypothetical protein